MICLTGNWFTTLMPTRITILYLDWKMASCLGSL
uniref:Uncharacterized protein n=1 Tax=Rhizophora mucronata TaxID=61149 RepID=A0A2P2N812_RHIMU